MGEDRTGDRPKQIMMLVGVSVFAVLGLFYYRNTVILEVGLITFAMGIFSETVGTKAGWWKYNGSPLYMVLGRIPLELIFGYFMIGCSAAIIALFFTNGMPFLMILSYFAAGIAVSTAAYFVLKKKLA